MSNLIKGLIMFDFFGYPESPILFVVVGDCIMYRFRDIGICRYCASRAKQRFPNQEVYIYDSLTGEIHA